jgi:CheY-like chemotaxis protein
MAEKRILIGEDDQSILKVTRYRLEHEGYEVLEAPDGEAVLRQVGTAGPVHLILLDIKMPRLNGYEVCRQLKSDPATARIPVIVFTASESQLTHLADRCIEAGASDWIKKPFRTKDLMQKIHRILGEEEAHPHG